MSAKKQKVWILWDMSNGFGKMNAYMWLTLSERAAWLKWRLHRKNMHLAPLSRPVKAEISGEIILDLLEVS